MVSPRRSAGCRSNVFPWLTRGKQCLLHGILNHGGSPLLDEGVRSRKLFAQTMPTEKNIAASMFNVRRDTLWLCEALENRQDLRTSWFSGARPVVIDAGFCDITRPRWINLKLYHLAKARNRQPIRDGRLRHRTAPRTSAPHALGNRHAR